MSKRIAIVENAVVKNIAAWDGISVWTPVPGATHYDITERPEVAIGWVEYVASTDDDGVETKDVQAPPPPEDEGG